MNFRAKTIVRPKRLPPWLLFVLFALNASGFSTGVPSQFAIDPATVRQQDKDETSVKATVRLRVPSPTFFVCQIRSSDKDKVSFANIIFAKGQLSGKAEGLVHWSAVKTDCRVKVSAFSVDAPDGQLWFTISLKTADDDEPAAGSNAPQK
jgi:hypothetical protein